MKGTLMSWDIAVKLHEVAVDGGIGLFSLALDHPDSAAKALGGLIAASAIVSNTRALKQVRKSIVTCDHELNFRGLRIGRSEPYVVPLRSLFFAYALLVFYQIISQVTGAVRDASLADLGVEVFLQGMLVFFVYWNYRRIKAQSAEALGLEDGRIERFNRKLDEALKDKKISVTDLLRSVAIFPLASVVPKMVETFSPLPTCFFLEAFARLVKVELFRLP